MDTEDNSLALKKAKHVLDIARRSGYLKSKSFDDKDFIDFFVPRLNRVGKKFDFRLVLECYFIYKKLQDEDDFFMVITGNEGCLTGDTIINTQRNTLGRKYRLDYMYKQFHKIPEEQRHKNWNLNAETHVRSFNGEAIRIHKINDVIYSGKKQVFELTLENGKQIKATATHKIMTQEGWVELQNLTNKHEVMCDTLLPQKGKQIRFKLKDIALRTCFHPFKNGRDEVEVHRLIYESYMNELKFMDFMDILWTDEETAKTLKYNDPSKFHIHHIDGSHYNNSIDNLELIDANDHPKLHAKQDESFKHFNQGVPIYSKVVSINKLGVEKTYDIQCEEPHHNFVANGMVVHNSGKSTLAFQVASFINSDFGTKDITLKTSTYVKRIKEIVEERKEGNRGLRTICIDEGAGVLYSRKTMSKDNTNITTVFSIQRFLNTFVVVNIPNFRDLDKSLKEHRVDALLYVTQRGYYKFISKKGISLLNEKLKNYKSSDLNKINIPTNTFFYGKFNKGLPNNLNKDEYEEHKLNNFYEILKTIDNVDDEPKKGKLLKLSNVAKQIGVKTRLLTDRVRLGKINATKINGQNYITEEEYKKLTNQA